MSGSPLAASKCMELFELLRNQPYFAGLARATALAAESDLAKAAPIYQSLDWWGGSGSLADSAGADLPRIQKKQLLALIADIRDIFHDAGIDYDRADMWADTFRSWLRDGVFDQEPS